MHNVAALAPVPAESPDAVHWDKLPVRAAALSSVAVALGLFGGVMLGAPGAGIIVGSGATTVSFSTEMQLDGSYLRTMVAATMAMTLSTFIGMFSGHHGYSLLLSAAVWSFASGVLTISSPTKGWIAQQAALTVMVTSAFPEDAAHASARAMLTFSGGLLQICSTALLRKELPELVAVIQTLPAFIARKLRSLRHEISVSRLIRRVSGLSRVAPILARSDAVGFATRLMITTVVATEVYRWRGVQSGYWIPATVLLVQRPRVIDTRDRMFLRIAGTVAGAALSTQLLTYFRPGAVVVAAFTVLCCFGALVLRKVNYGLFTLLMTSYLISLLSLTLQPVPEIATRRFIDTIIGGVLAFTFHLFPFESSRKDLR